MTVSHHAAATAAETLVRPTEAQLRWAQFHHKRRAVGVRAKIDLLHQSPESVDQVSGAFPEDGASSSSCSESLVEIRQRRPKVSRGRKALLRVSRRKFEVRRHEITELGGRSVQSHEDEEHDELLEDIFKTQPSRHQRKRKDHESFKRFQAACHAMMMNLAAPPKLPMVIPSRKWTRTANAAAYLDDEYLDPKWGIRRQQPTTTEMLENAALVPMDRGASWMIHLPKALSSARENPYYHDPSLAIPPTAGSRTASDTQYSECALPQQASGVQKFSTLVALVQQRMIERQEGLQTVKGAKRGAPTVRLQRGNVTDESERKDGIEENQMDERNHEFHERKDVQSSWSPTMGGRNRKSHYIPRMRLRDFLPEGTTSEEVEELERSIMDGKGIPPRMKLREFPNQSPPLRRKSRAKEIAESFEPKEERRLSKTRLMVQSLEGPNHPMMRLRQSLGGTDDEKKSSEDNISAASPLSRHAHALSEPFSGIEGKGGGYTAQQAKRRHHSSSGAFSSSPPSEQTSSDSRQRSDPAITAASLITEASSMVQNPPRRKLHPMSAKFVQAVNVSHDEPVKKEIVVRPQTPGSCCSRCSKSSPVASKRFTEKEKMGDFVAQVYQVNPKVPTNSARISDFFSQLRQGNDPTDDMKGSSTSGSSSRRQSTRKERASDFFASIRQLNPPTEQLEEDVLLEDTDFFAQVREMIATEEDSTETAARRVSDFFAQVREMSQEEEGEFSALCEQCQVENIEGPIEEEDVTLSLAHGASNRVSTSTAGSAPVPPVGTIRGNSDVDGQSVHSGISGLWNRGRASLATTINVISEKTAHVVANPGQPVSKNVPGRVGDFLQRLQGAKESEVMTKGEAEKQPQSIEENVGSLPEADFHGLAYDGLDDFDVISEKTAHVVANPGQPRDLVSTNTPGRVGDFLQHLQGAKESALMTKEEAEKQPQPIEENTQHVGTPPEADFHGLAYDGLDDFEAMANYRKSQEYKRLSASMNDDTSSHSSFHTLPTGILEVVKRHGSTPTKSPRHVSTSPHNGLIDAGTSTPRMSTSDQAMKPGSVDSGPPSSSLSTSSPSRVSHSASAPGGLSHAKYRLAHETLIRNSPLLGTLDQDIIDTDGTTSDASYSGMDPSVLASLMLSPDLLQKRLHQAVRAVEDSRWDQVRYLLNANPWLAEMCELTTNQYLVHKIAFFGRTAPMALCEQLIEMFPSAVYKFDQDGNVPLHLAAAAGHFKMIRLLGEHFEGGASIRNEDGMLPLHFTIASYSDYSETDKEQCEHDETNSTPLTVIQAVLNLFPKAVAIGDNDGNLPIHVAAECLVGNFGVETVYMLLDEADRQLHDGARFYNKVKLEDIVNEDMSAGSLHPFKETDSMIDDDIHCSMVRNDFGDTPLFAAVRCRRGWDMIEALVSGPGGHVAAMYEDAEKNNVLHLLVGEHQDPAAAVSILKIAPRTASMRNSEGMLPIEVACLQLMPPEVILAIALVDLPFDIDDKDLIMTREDGGGSWWFLTCECDDHYVDIVQQIIMISTFQQVQQLSFTKGGPRNQQQSVLSRATPKCRQVLQHALRFLGRFEIIGDGPLECDESSGVTVFDALDYSETENDEGRRVILKCYSTEETFSDAISSIEGLSFDPAFVQGIEIIRSESHPRQLCLLIECPQATLNRVVDGMMKKPGYQNDIDLRQKYAAKMCAVLRLIAKALRHLHRSGFVHGNLCLENCGKFDHFWKLLDPMRLVRVGEIVDPARFDKSFPPEALRLDDGEDAIFDSDNPSVTFQALRANPSMDIWAFGKLAFEALVGEPLVDFDPSVRPSEDGVSLLEILEWDHSSLKRVFTGLLESGVTDSCAEMITSCLFPNPEDRPANMDVILEDPFWKEMRQFRERSTPWMQSSPTGGFAAASSKSLFTENASVNTSIEHDRAEI